MGGSGIPDTPKTPAICFSRCITKQCKQKLNLVRTGCQPCSALSVLSQHCVPRTGPGRRDGAHWGSTNICQHPCDVWLREKLTKPQAGGFCCFLFFFSTGLKRALDEALV